MYDILAIDSNFYVPTKLQERDLRFYDVNQTPFQIYGVFYDSGRFLRIPAQVAETVNDGVLRLNGNAAGGRVRFRTDSPHIAIYAKMSEIGKMSHFALTGSAGFDLYLDHVGYLDTFKPPIDITDGFEAVVYRTTSGMQDFTINFPLYSQVNELYIGLSQDARIEAPKPYAIEKPIVYYGSSITQGGCASRPGNSYESIISRRFHWDYINLGFSGNARGEQEIADYISGLEMSVFVCDYDHNAPSVEHLEKTHQRLYQTVRQAKPNLPIILMSRPAFYLTEEEQQRFAIIQRTYAQAKAAGDDNVYLLNGPQLMALAGNEGTVDNCHPNDLGFVSMAKALGDLLETILPQIPGDRN